MFCTQAGDSALLSGSAASPRGSAAGPITEINSLTCSLAYFYRPGRDEAGGRDVSPDADEWKWVGIGHVTQPERVQQVAQNVLFR